MPYRLLHRRTPRFRCWEGQPAYEESLALFGLPLAAMRMETNSSGDTVLTQWFERARFEFHPNKPEPGAPRAKVLLGLPGNEITNRGGNGSISRPTE